MRIALVNNGVVENIIEADETFTPDNGFDAIPTDTAGPGWLWDGSVFTEPK